MNFTTQFLYDMGNMELYRPDISSVLIGFFISFACFIVLKYILLYHVGFFILWREARSIAAKKNVLGDLILMKDIQTEMEKELEQASLRATFQG